MTELTIKPLNNPDQVGFSMYEIEVDGIQGNKNTLHSNLLFSFKYEEDVFGDPSDTGKPYNWSAKWEVSDKHWLSCGVVIPLHAQCLVCGKRD